MYDELERLRRQFQKDVERVEGMILRGGEETIPDLLAYRTKCAELKVWRMALKAVEDVKKETLQEIA